MTPADRPPVTDDARAEAMRRYPSDIPDRGLTYPTVAVREHSQAAFVAGAEWVADLTETATDDPHDSDGNRLTPEWQPEATTDDARAEAVRKVLHDETGGCTCHPSYVARRREEPGCAWHDIERAIPDVIAAARTETTKVVRR